MAIWILFSILAMLFWAIGNIIDKFVFTRWVVKPIVPAIVLGIFGLIVSLIIYLTQGFAELSNINIVLAILAGVFYIFAYLLYFKSDIKYNGRRINYAGYVGRFRNSGKYFNFNSVIYCLGVCVGYQYFLSGYFQRRSEKSEYFY